MRPIGCAETSVRNYQWSLRNDPEERCSHLLRGGRLKSRVLFIGFVEERSLQKKGGYARRIARYIALRMLQPA